VSHCNERIVYTVHCIDYLVTSVSGSLYVVEQFNASAILYRFVPNFACSWGMWSVWCLLFM